MDLPDIFSVPTAVVADKLNSLTPDELANFAKETATKSLNTLFKLYNDLLVKHKLEYYYTFKIDVRNK